jgi:hypothetical protein
MDRTGCKAGNGSPVASEHLDRDVGSADRTPHADPSPLRRAAVPHRDRAMNAPGDPLTRLRNALAGLGLAVLLSVPLAAMAGSALGAVFGDSYGIRVAIYGALLLHVITGAVVLFVRVAQHETQPLSAARVLRWLLSVWVWPLLFLGSSGGRKADPGP